jgi:hypothetical protein
MWLECSPSFRGSSKGQRGELSVSRKQGAETFPRERLRRSWRSYVWSQCTLGFHISKVPMGFSCQIHACSE